MKITSHCEKEFVYLVVRFVLLLFGVSELAAGTLCLRLAHFLALLTTSKTTKLHEYISILSDFSL